MAMTADEFAEKAKKFYKRASEREKERLEHDKEYFHDWIQRLIGWLQIITNFVKRLCFLSTAVYRRHGLGDDCLQLKTLREFRDTYLLGSGIPSRVADVDEYYRIAPGIWLWIDGQEDADSIWDHLGDVVETAVKLVVAGKMKEAHMLYKRKILGLIPYIGGRVNRGNFVP